MWINDKVTYTPDIITKTAGEPVSGVVKGVSQDGATLTVAFADGTEERVPVANCKPSQE